jgi:hypothetical protein
MAVKQGGWSCPGTGFYTQCASNAGMAILFDREIESEARLIL